MASALDAFVSRLQQISSQSNATRSSAYDALISELLRQPSSSLSPQDLLQATSLYLQNAVFSEQNATGGGLVIGRQALSAFEQQVANIAAEFDTKQQDQESMRDIDDAAVPALAERDTRRQVLENALEQLQSRVLSFEEQASSLRLQLAALLEAEEDWNEAARVLLAIPLDSGHRNISDHFKLSMYMRIVRLLLEGDDPVAADIYLKRASMVIHNVPGALPSLHQREQETETDTGSGASDPTGSPKQLDPPKVLGLQFRLSQARVYDSQRRFAEAAIRYHELSYVTDIDEDDRAMMLSAAVTASILSPAGPQRSRTLATLVRDERTQSIPQYTILSKVFLDHIIRPDEIKAFEKLLSPHQVAKLASTNAINVNPQASSSGSIRHAPSTVLDRAMIEHNVLSASRLYDNITLEGLGDLVDLSPEGAEDIARKMIMQGRLKAWIDQVGTGHEARGGGVLFFVDQEKRIEGETTAGGLSATKSEGQVEGTEGTAESFGAAGFGDLDTKWTRRWDQQIASLTNQLEGVCQRLKREGLSDTMVA